MSGHSLQNLLEKANPFGTGDCGGGDKCLKCGYGGEGKSCRKRGGAYDITCEEEECKEAGWSEILRGGWEELLFEGA